MACGAQVLPEQILTYYQLDRLEKSFNGITLIDPSHKSIMNQTIIPQRPIL